jgi:hypothetical protein
MHLPELTHQIGKGYTEADADHDGPIHPSAVVTGHVRNLDDPPMLRVSQVASVPSMGLSFFATVARGGHDQKDDSVVSTV